MKLLKLLETFFCAGDDVQEMRKHLLDADNRKLRSAHRKLRIIKNNASELNTYYTLRSNYDILWHTHLFY